MTRRTFRRFAFALILATAAGAHAADDAARQVLALAGINGGLAVHVGCGDGTLTAALGASGPFLVQGLDRDPANVAKARAHIRSLGLYGKVAVDRWDGRELPFVDNLVNLLVVERNDGLAKAEMLRVLAPGGVACIKGPAGWRKVLKPRPRTIDEWTHCLYDSTNNAVSHDVVVGPPRRLQWVGSPPWARHHDHVASLSAMVSAGGRLFYIFDEGPTASLQLPPRWRLVARDAFSGVVLWKRPIEKWWPHLWPLKSGPTFLARRLVAAGDRVYVTLGLNAPTSCLDAATGKTIHTYEKTYATEEIIFSGGVLFLVVNRSPRTLKYSRLADLYALNNKWDWDGRPRDLVAIEAESGRELWRVSHPVVQMTLAVDSRRVYFHDGQKVVCLDRRSGRRLWQSKPLPRLKPIPTWSAPTLVVYKDVVVFAGAEKMIRHRGGKDTMTALSAETGKVLWTAPHPPSGYDSPEDIFVIDDLVWTAPTTNRSDSGVFTGRDIHTGEVKVRFPPDDGQHMPHHRCHRARATVRYILTSRTGIEYVDFRARHWNRNDWVRGSCNFGLIAANGLTYAPQHSCACYIVAKLNGLNALAAGPLPRFATEQPRLVRGPAYGQGLDPQPSPAPGDWPTYRHDPARSGRATTEVPTPLAALWRADLGGHLTSPVVAAGRLFVAAKESHTLHALDTATGKKLWDFVAGGRIDSPPTYHRGLLLFGCADGWVYCVRAADGALVWRFRAGPADRRLVAWEQVESVWPLHGSVLVVNGEAHCVAGRSAFLDGGLRYLRLDPATGKLLGETILDEKDPKTGKRLDANITWPNLPVGLPDVLSCDGRHVYMRSQPFDLQGRRTAIITPRNFRDQSGPTAHLFCPTGFLDDTWWHRTYWLYGKTPVSAAGGWYLAAWRTPAGRILVFDDQWVYGFGRQPRHFPATTWMEYHLFSTAKHPRLVQPPPASLSRLSPRERARIKRRGPHTWPKWRWTTSIPILARGMVLAGKTLFVAGPPDLVNEQEACVHLDDARWQALVAAQAAALEGRKGGKLLVVAADDGTTKATLDLDAPPVWDGLVAANGRLYMATTDGKVLSFGGTK